MSVGVLGLPWWLELSWSGIADVCLYRLSTQIILDLTLTSSFSFHWNRKPIHARQLSWNSGNHRKGSHITAFHSNLPKTASRPSSQFQWPLPQGLPQHASLGAALHALSWGTLEPHIILLCWTSGSSLLLFPNLQYKPIWRIYKWTTSLSVTSTWKTVFG